jgi:hypothetical protein
VETEADIGAAMEAATGAVVTGVAVDASQAAGAAEDASSTADLADADSAMAITATVMTTAAGGDTDVGFALDTDGMTDIRIEERPQSRAQF